MNNFQEKVSFMWSRHWSAGGQLQQQVRVRQGHSSSDIYAPIGLHGDFRHRDQKTSMGRLASETSKVNL